MLEGEKGGVVGGTVEVETRGFVSRFVEVRDSASAVVEGFALGSRPDCESGGEGGFVGCAVGRVVGCVAGTVVGAAASAVFVSKDSIVAGGVCVDVDFAVQITSVYAALRGDRQVGRCGASTWE